MLGVHRVGRHVYYFIDVWHRLVIFGRGAIPNFIPKGPLEIKMSDEDYMNRSPYMRCAPWSKDYFTKVIICGGITRVGAYAFAGMTAIHEVYLATSVESIGKGAFKECKLISKFVLPNSEIDIHPTAFLQVPLSSLQYELGKDGGFGLRGAGLYHYGRNELVIGADTEDIIIEDGIKDIHPFAFAHHNRVKRVKCPAALERIGVSAFEGCENLAEIMAIPNDCVLGRNALRGTSKVNVKFRESAVRKNPPERPIVAISEHGRGILFEGKFTFYEEKGVPNIDPTPFYGHQDIVDIKGGKNFIVGLRANGEVIYADSNHYADILDTFSGPVRFEDSFGFGKCYKWKNVCQIAAGGYIVAGLREDGTVYCSGTKDGNVTMEMLEDVICVEVDANEVLYVVRKNGECVKIDYSERKADSSIKG